MQADRLKRLRYGLHEFFYTLLSFPRAWRFMLAHRLWRGLREYGWVARALVAFGVVSGLFLIAEVVDWWDRHAEDPLYTLAVGSDSLLLRIFHLITESLSDGALNWLTLILLEVVIYHFMRRALFVILDKRVENAHTFKPFYEAQIRMIKVSTLGLVGQTIFIELGEWLLPGPVAWAFALLIQAFVIGYVIADNYNEQFELTIEQSFRYLWRNYIGICLGLGLPLFLMLKVPLFGTILGPLVTSVVAAIVLREKSDLHVLGYRMSAEERAKADKAAAKRAAKDAKKARRAAKKAAKRHKQIA